MESKRNIGKTRWEMPSVTFLLLIILSAFFKVVAHPPNFQPQLVIVLFFGCLLSTRILWFCILANALLGDLLLHWIYGYPIFGYWTLFSYSALLLIGFSGHVVKLNSQNWSFVPAAFLTSFFFWIWTNFGVWLTSGMYDMSISGLTRCYIAALPFLNNTLLAAISASVIFVVFARLRNFTAFLSKNISF